MARGMCGSPDRAIKALLLEIVAATSTATDPKAFFLLRLKHNMVDGANGDGAGSKRSKLLFDIVFLSGVDLFVN
jgi:hypothetical protein